MKIYKALKEYENLLPYAKGVGLGCLFAVNLLRLLAVFLLPTTLWLEQFPMSAVLCSCYVILYFVTNSISVTVFTKLHIFPRIDMTKKVLFKKAPALNFRQQIEGNVASTRSLIEEGLFGMALGTIFAGLSIVAALYFSFPVGICAVLGLLLLLPDRHRHPNVEEKDFLEHAFKSKENAEEKLVQFSDLPRQKIHVYRIEWTVLLRLAAFAAVCLGGRNAVCSYVYFELALYFILLFKKGRNESCRQINQLEQISNFLNDDWPDAK